MALASYTDIVSETQDWLFGRSDLAAKVPTFVRLCEAKLNLQLRCRQMETRAVAAVDMTASEPEFVDLPKDFHTMRRIRVASVPGKPRLRFATTVQIDALREETQDQPGQPLWFSLVGQELELLPTPDRVYTLEMIARLYLPPLSSTNSTNWLLELAPQAYLYGTLLEAAPYLHDDDRIAVWANGLQGAIEGINRLSEDASYNAGPLVMRRGRSYC